MVKDQKITGLFPDLLIHPGETLAEILDERQMSQKELALRTGVTEKHVCTVVKGAKGISVSFAKKLEYALGIDANFWINLQGNYDREVLEYEEVNRITEEEVGILKPLQKVTDYMTESGMVEKNLEETSKVLALRHIFGVSNLTVIPSITYNAVYRMQMQSDTGVNAYVLYAWQRICELLSENIKIAKQLDLNILRNRIPEIKSIMFDDDNAISAKLTALFADCGIAFCIVRHFPGAPVQGFIKYREDGRLLLCLTLRQGRADIFWFTLFHEIAHILNGDIKHKFIDFDAVYGETEVKANMFAKDVLLDEEEYRDFVAKGDFSLPEIEVHARKQAVKNYIVVGRLQSEGWLDWNEYNQEMVYYKWA